MTHPRSLLRRAHSVRARALPAAATLGLVLAAIDCKKKPEPSAPELAPSGSAAKVAPAAGNGLPAGHPSIPTRESLGVGPEVLPDDMRPHHPEPPPQNWNAACLVKRKCPSEPAPIPTCEAGADALEWGQLEYDADKHIGETASVKGPIALTAARPPGTQKCPPGVCCHSLLMNVVIDGRPNAIALAGFSCKGDDSAMCCNVQTDLQSVIATGKIQKAPPASGLKFQLVGAKFCTPAPPPKPDAGMGADGDRDRPAMH